MKCKRLNEVIELLQPARQKEPELNLMQFCRNSQKKPVTTVSWSIFPTIS